MAAASPTTSEVSVSPRRLRIGRGTLIAIAIIGYLVVGKLLEGKLHPGWPDAIRFDLQARGDRFNNWVTNNQDTSPVFLYFFNYVKLYLSDLARWLDDFWVALRWPGFCAILVFSALRFASRSAAVIVAVACASFWLFGLFQVSVETLTLVLISVLISLLIGLPLGLIAGRSSRFLKVITPLLDAMQIFPAFAYLVPAAIIFGIGSQTGIIVTIVFAIPACIRITALGIRGVPANTIEAARSTGASSGQIMRKVQMPLALPQLLLAVNQTVMLALGMITIAALIGAGGLGNPVTEGLQTQSLGESLRSGLAIVMMAIALDRSLQAVGERYTPGPHKVPAGMGSGRTPTLIAAVAVIAAAVAGRVLGLGLTPSYDLASRWDARWQTIYNYLVSPSHFVYPITSGISNFLTKRLAVPLQSLMQQTPWWLTMIVVIALAYLIGRRWKAIIVPLLAFAAIGVFGIWVDAMDTLSQVISATVLTVILGTIIGVIAAQSHRLESALKPLLDTMQTLPGLVYLVPVVALFGVGLISGLIAAIVYALPVVVRLVTQGIRSVPPAPVEAARAFGATRWEILLKVQMPLARDSIMLAINQGLIMVLAVITLAALVGGGGALGNNVLVGLSRGEFGVGLAASVAILAMGIGLDRITQSAARRNSATDR